MNEQQQKKPLEILCSRHFLAWLYEQQISLAFTTYQSCRLFFIGMKQDGSLSAFERLFDHAMGLYASPERLYMSSKYQIWQFDNVLNPNELYKGYDRLYVPRIGFTTGDLDVHDIVVDKNGRLTFVNTLYSCLATLNDRYSFTPLWKPPFISKLAPEDRCHLNGLAMANGIPKYVTAVSRSDVFEGWREKRSSGGLLMEIPSGEPLATGLSMPHSPRVYKNRIWLLNSGTGELGFVDTTRGRFEPVTFCRGYARGLAFHNDYAIVGLSKPRSDRAFTGLPLDERLVQKDTEPACGLMVVDINTGDIVHWMMLEGVTTELYDVQVLPGIRRPMALGHKTDEIKTIINLPPEHRHPSNPGISRTDDTTADQPHAGKAGLSDYQFRLNDTATPVDIIKISGITFPNVQKRWQAKTAGAPLVLVTASVENNEIAAAVAEIDKTGERAEIISFHVAPEYRKQGIGARLINLMEGALFRKGCSLIEIQYRSDWDGSKAVETIINRQGWLPPKTPRILYKTTIDRIAAAPWIQDMPALNEGLVVIPWQDVTDADREHIENRKRDDNWFPDMLSPFQAPSATENINSLALRKNGEIAGWIITHRPSSDTIQYSSLFVDDSLRGTDAALALVAEAVSRQIQAGISEMIWMTETRNRAVQKFIDKHIGPWVESTSELHLSARVLKTDPDIEQQNGVNEKMNGTSYS
ncbi:MAG: TIGR03032 family protein [Thermodesulfobacteriota bacterium]|nr:TIGR03032 family protein [Thermodesulfobacteriota bacterium]